MVDAAANLWAGNLVAFPTETVYGLGADACNALAVARIYAAKGRPADHPLIVHVASMDALGDWASDVPEYAISLARDFWPGPMTLIMKRSALAGDFVTGGQDTVGIRVPDHTAALGLLEAFERAGGKGVAAPSANLSGHCSPYTAQHVANDFHNRNLTILDDSENRFSRCGIESSVIKLDENVPGSLNVTVLRTGLVGGNRIKRILDAHNVPFHLEYYVRLGSDSEKIGMDCPGQLFRHYAPMIPAYIENFDARHTIDAMQLHDYVIIGANGSLKEYNDKCLIYYDLGASIVDVAKNIYSVLRLAEKVSGAKGIIISVKNLEEFADKESDLDKAITDKLLRCSEGHITRIG